MTPGGGRGAGGDARDYTTGEPARPAWITAVLIAAAAAAAPPSCAAESKPPGEEQVAIGPLAMHPARAGAVSLRIDLPVVRIGLTTDARRMTLSGAGDYFIVDPATGRNLWVPRHSGPTHVVLQVEGGEPASRFRVQVASLASEEAAHALRERVETETREVAVVTHDPDRGTYRIRVGAASSREAIQAVEEKLRAMGFAETWIVEESVGRAGRLRLRLVDEEFEDLVIEPTPFLVLPAVPGRPLRVNGKPYRGAIEVRVVESTRLKAVNVLNLEEYLRGVVPLELGPTVFPEMEALKAQAVAARTYVVANRGQFSSEGHDICDTARCQVYGGMEGEDPMTDRAILETEGLVLTYGGSPINALYTATCGGHTEDVVNVFREEAEEAPYLRGVSCYADEEVLASWRRVLKGATPPPPSLDPAGVSLDDALAILEARGVVSRADRGAERLAGVVDPAEIAQGVTRVLALAGKTNAEPALAASPYPSVAAFAAYLAGALEWRERVTLFLTPSDLPLLLGSAALRGAAEQGLYEVAFLIKEGILPPRLAPGEDLLAPVTRSLLYRVLHRILARYDALDLREAIYRGSRAERLILVPAKSEIDGLPAAVEIEPAPDLTLARGDGADAVLVSEITLTPGDRVHYLLRDGRAAYLRQRANVRGASDDRFTTNYQWEVRYSREELEEKIRARASIGRLVDVQPVERGVSGRVTELRVIGTAGRFTFRGFGIRTLLGLKENLFVVDRQRDGDGTIRTYVFAGKGWGHGVGLCQVGAFGMALKGADYLEILSRYYTGVTVQPLVWE